MSVDSLHGFSSCADQVRGYSLIVLDCRPPFQSVPLWRRKVHSASVRERSSTTAFDGVLFAL